MEEVIIDVDEAGKVTVSARGIKGIACKDATRAVERALGEVEERRATGEMHERPQEVRHGQRG